jgi:hypothetical protein
MPLTLNCPKCHKPFRVRDESVGMRVKCPTCAAILQVPADLAPAAAKSGGSAGAAPKRPAGQPVASKTAKAGGGDDLFEDLPDNSSSGPPSIPPARTQPMKRSREEEDDEPKRDERNKRSGGRATVTGPLPPVSPARKAARGKPTPRRSETEADPQQIIDDAAGWRKVKKGLGWVQFGFLLAALPILGHFATVAYCVYEKSKIPADVSQPGLLGKGMSLWQELEVAYVGIFALATLVMLLGQVGITRVPESARTRGLAGGTAFLTFMAFAAAAIYGVAEYGHRLGGPDLPRVVGEVSWIALLAFGLLSFMWIFLFAGQAGVPLRANRVLPEIGMSILLIALLVAAAKITDKFYAIFVTPEQAKATDDGMRAFLIEQALYLVVGILMVFRSISILGIVRRGVRRWLEEHKDTLEAVTD